MKKILTTCTLLLSLCTTQLSAQAGDKFRVLLEWYVNPDHGPIVIAQQKGYFKDAGLDVEIIEPADPNAPPKLLAAKQADLITNYHAQQYIQVNAGLPITRIGVLVGQPLWCLLVRNDGPKTLAELKGKRIGISVGTVGHALRDVMVKHAGFSNDDFEWVNINFNTTGTLLAKTVDASFGAYRNFDPNYMELENVPSTCIPVESYGIPIYEELVYNVHKDDLKDPKRVAQFKAFLSAVQKATDDIRNDPDGTFDLFKTYNKNLNDKANKMIWADTWPLLAKDVDAINIKMYQTMLDFNVKAGLIKKARPLSDYYTDLSK